jgi:hypothetical protein
METGGERQRFREGTDDTVIGRIARVEGLQFQRHPPCIFDKIGAPVTAQAGLSGGVVDGIALLQSLIAEADAERDRIRRSLVGRTEVFRSNPDRTDRGADDFGTV